MNQEELKKARERTDALVKENGLTMDGDLRDRFYRSIGELEGWDTFRINPVSFAEQRNLPLDETLLLFIYAVKGGLFYFEWNLLCPLCGGREHSHNSLYHIEKEHYHCTNCDVDVDVDVAADSHMEVSFTVLPQISEFLPEPHRSLQDYRAYFFSSHLAPPPETARIMKKIGPLKFTVLDDRKGTCFRIRSRQSRNLRIYTLDTHSMAQVQIRGDLPGAPLSGTLSHSETGFDTRKIEVAAGENEVRLINRSGSELGFLTAPMPNPDQLKVMAGLKPEMKPFLTARTMLNNQHFRELYLVDNLPNDLALRVNDITLLFTDLKGSTELYDRTGDIRAYRLVEEHFRILKEIVIHHRGALVKTM